MKLAIGVLIGAIVAGIGVYFFLSLGSTDYKAEEKEEVVTDVTETEGEEQDDAVGLTVEMPEEDEGESVIGTSVEERDIMAYHYGKGETELLFVGGIHGAYEWNTVLVAYELMDYLEENPEAIPENVKVTVIPVLNPDGLERVVGTAGRFSAADVPSSQNATVPGRFNARDVDLNRNFDCDWQPTATWQNKTVSGGTKMFSEPESQAVRGYVEVKDPAAVVVWYSAAGGVFSSSCHNGVLEETRTITNIFADASGYRAYEEFDFYEITGDMVNWLAKNEIPAISVLLSTHEDVEWDRNKRGVDALLEHYAE